MAVGSYIVQVVFDEAIGPQAALAASRHIRCIQLPVAGVCVRSGSATVRARRYLFALVAPCSAWRPPLGLPARSARCGLICPMVSEVAELA